MAASAAEAWNAEYQHQGIPSSHRDDPSGVLVWTLDNLRHITSFDVSQSIDLGCGTGRNAIAMSDAGMSVTAIDFSPVALEMARARPGGDKVTFLHGDVTHPLPVEDRSCELATDIFVYFHQLADEDRKAYRSEIRRVLVPGGILLASMATSEDGYYSTCPRLDSNEWHSSVPLVWDPAAEVGNILLSTDQFLDEFSDYFDLQMTWHKRKKGLMHGREYVRHTLATLWTARI